eukprot:scaffold23502_cov117-Skeletonema_marinoi.AAC.8
MVAVGASLILSLTGALFDWGVILWGWGESWVASCLLGTQRLTNTKLTASICDADFIESISRGTVRSRSDLSTYETSSVWIIFHLGRR